MTALTPTGPVLIVDDEADLRQLVSLSLSRIGIDTHAAANLGEARELLGTYEFACCLTDMRLPDGNGVDFVAELARTHPALPVAVITAHGQMNAAVEAMKNGAFDFVSKPVDLKVLRGLVLQAMQVSASPASVCATSLSPTTSISTSDTTTTADPRATADVSAETSSMTSDGTPLALGERLIGNAPPMQVLRDRIRKVARSNAPVWITGESGTGKELIAQLVHENSPRANGPFVAVNCGAIPAELVESELFGHRKGSFTGAHEDKAGLFRTADGGTLLLDEVAELPQPVQVKLLRAIQERKIRPVGVSEERSVDVRLLSASHIDLAALVEAGRFRQDLYYRLNVICIRSPCLRDRRDDLPALGDAILRRLSERDGTPPASLSPAAISRLSNYDFPGNVRELENVLERAHAMAGTALIDAGDLELGAEDGPLPVAPPPNRPAAHDSASADDERSRILAALERTRWNRRRAADELGLTYRQLRYRIAQLGLDDTDQAA